MLLATAGHPYEGVYSVRRRYSDFALLRETLVGRYLGLVVPPLPPKAGMMTHRTAGFVERRARALTLFADTLAHVATLLLDSTVGAFFGLPGSDSWEAAQRKLEATGYARHSNPGQLMWERLLGRVELDRQGLGGL